MARLSLSQPHLQTRRPIGVRAGMFGQARALEMMRRSRRPIAFLFEQVLTSSLSLLVLITASRSLAADQFVEFAQVFAIIALAQSFGAGVLSPIIMYGRFFSTMRALAGFVLGVAALPALGMVTANSFVHIAFLQTGGLVWLLAAMMFLLPLLDVVRRLCHRANCVMPILVAIALSHLPILLLALQRRLDRPSLLLTIWLCLVAGISLIGLWSLRRRAIDSPGQSGSGETLANLPFASVFFNGLALLALWAQTNGLLLMISNVVPAAAVAELRVSFSIAAVVLIIVSSLENMFVRKINAAAAKTSVRELHMALASLLGTIILLQISASSLLVYFAPMIFKQLFGLDFVSIRLFVAVMVFYSSLSIAKPLFIMLRLQHRSWVIFIVNAAGAAGSYAYMTLLESVSLGDVATAFYLASLLIVAGSVAASLMVFRPT